MSRLIVGHPQWNEFVGRLGQALNPQLNDDGQIVSWSCETDLRRTEAIVGEMGFDVEATLTYLTEHGGYCDCEVLLNVEAEAEHRRACGGDEAMTSGQLVTLEADGVIAALRSASTQLEWLSRSHDDEQVRRQALITAGDLVVIAIAMGRSEGLGDGHHG
jgi:hypothetical protein